MIGVAMGREYPSRDLGRVGLAMLEWAALNTEYATAELQNMAPTVAKYVRRQQFALALRPDGAIAGFAIWCWATDDEVAEWAETGVRPNHGDEGPNLLFLRFTADPDAVRPLVRALQAEFPGKRGIYRRSKRHQFIRMGGIASCAA